MSSGHLLLSCAKRAATAKISFFAYLRQLPCALFSLILMTLSNILSYAEEIFGEPFDRDVIITEELRS